MLIISYSCCSNLFFKYFTVIHVMTLIAHSGCDKARWKCCVCPHVEMAD